MNEKAADVLTNSASYALYLFGCRMRIPGSFEDMSNVTLTYEGFDPDVQRDQPLCHYFH